MASSLLIERSPPIKVPSSASPWIPSVCVSFVSRQRSHSRTLFQHLRSNAVMLHIPLRGLCINIDLASIDAIDERFYPSIINAIVNLWIYYAAKQFILDYCLWCCGWTYLIPLSPPASLWSYRLQIAPSSENTEATKAKQRLVTILFIIQLQVLILNERQVLYGFFFEQVFANYHTM